MNKGTEAKDNGIEKKIIAVVRNRWDVDNYEIFMGVSFQEVAEQIEGSKYGNEKGISIDIFKDLEDIRPRLADVCSHVSTIAELINPECVSGDHTRHLATILLTELAGEMASLTEAVNAVNRDIAEEGVQP
ncbi:MAG: hypothetical protein NTX36_12500 [Proteobacteria bacterium]|nr:hypothetical protein [Pseudomonadota bacterium]